MLRADRRSEHDVELAFSFAPYLPSSRQHDNTDRSSELKDTLICVNSRDANAATKRRQRSATLARSLRRAPDGWCTAIGCVPHAKRATFSKAALPNGIVLPEPWPPSGRSYADFVSDPP